MCIRDRAYGVSLMGKSMVKLFVLGMIPVILVVTVVNMLTNPRGNTVIYLSLIHL